MVMHTRFVVSSFSAVSLVAFVGCVEARSGWSEAQSGHLVSRDLHLVRTQYPPPCGVSL